VGTSCLADAPTCAGESGFPFACDGNEDCTDVDAVCCMTYGGTSVTTACVAQAECDEPASEGLVCVDSSECPTGAVCCGLDVGFPLPVDFGVCASTCGE
jgi:hypothetical protein